MAKCLLENEELVGKFLECISLSMSIEQSRKACNISKQTIYTYINNGKLDRENNIVSKYTDFLDKLEKAEMSFIEENIKVIRNASKKGSWQASAWLLERRLPKMFALRKEDEVEKGSKAVEVKVTFEDTANEKSEDELEAQVKKELK